MTQEQSRRRRSNRADRNRPVLVTSSTETEGETNSDDTEVEQIETIEETPVAEEVPATPQKTRRLPGFFSTIGKKPTEETPEADVAQARLARATRKAGTTTTKAAESAPTEEKQEQQETKPKPTPARTTTTRPSGGFKTRYLLGMVIYLLGANFIGVFETQFMAANHLYAVLTTFNLFGGKVIISTSTVVFLATLIILLVVLAKLDLIPRSLGALAGQPEPARRGQIGNKSNTTDQEPTPKTPPPTMRQGVKGADDDIYADYRADQRYMQRRARKRS
jgi:hypothetical protein